MPDKELVRKWDLPKREKDILSAFNREFSIMCIRARAEIRGECRCIIMENDIVHTEAIFVHPDQLRIFDTILKNAACELVCERMKLVNKLVI